MLIPKIKTSGFLLILGFLLVSCSKNPGHPFFNGEWMSDSLVTKENDHWREFLHFENGKVAQTTRWGKKYLLHKNMAVKDLKIYDQNNVLYQIKLLDSNRIILEASSRMMMSSMI